ncbi:MAG: hypothetical protein BJG00_006190 [Limnothrix sp. CACIAM 69d]|nr:MAG: hypothetical protein BJG00_006190 [Limnothrix sp. CACIAM 69d]
MTPKVQPPTQPQQSKAQGNWELAQRDRPAALNQNTLKPPKNYPLLPETTDRSGLAGYQLETQLPGIAKALTAPSSDVTLFEEGGLT